ncbi:hypothetical protein CY34DRAFT_17576 [Suillus luteus UH-Slu-Lm8-n1]|uniref:F-box domain-containing protein n=1 Tax=Suillus luteus UH-Slu-Lm8-n1 TaxID=930992 RepID=A0A0D0A920_9AGAM|nr:hypothetical protein CY34DRAFT_17576 [Suillus luteus UH-Slu-Lm8-n1]
MHRAFDSENIIYSVLKHLKFSPKDLKNVAMTCSRLAGPALNILWSEQSSLAPLIMCLPHDTRKSMDSTIHLSREPTPSEWERLRMNASRVRRFSEPPHFYWRFPPATFFPNLCAFDPQALQQYRSDIPLIRKFMSPGLEALLLDVSTYFPMHKVERFLGALPVEAHVLPSFGKLPKLTQDQPRLFIQIPKRRIDTTKDDSSNGGNEVKQEEESQSLAEETQARETDTVKGDNSSDIESLEKEEDRSSESSDESEDECTLALRGAIVQINLPPPTSLV